MTKKSIGLMFSGGIDSTYTACLLAQQYDVVHLMTYDMEYGHYHIERTVKRVHELQKQYNCTFIHAIISTKKLFNTLVIDNLKRDYNKYKSAFIWCMGCKIAMHTQSIMYCIQNNLSEMTDGSSRDTDEMVEQMEPSIACINDYYAAHHISFTVPAYDATRQEKIDFLKKHDFHFGLQIRDRFMGIQPVCIPGELYYLPYLLFNTPLKHDETVVCDFIKTKIETAEKFIKEATHS